MTTQRIQFKEWLPDQPSILDSVSEANNVIPLAVGYGPFQSAANYSESASEDLTNVFATKINNDVAIFAGGLTKLFKLDSTTLALDSVGKSAARTITNVALTSNVATITTALAHGFSTGDSVTVDASNNTFDGSYTITGTPTTTTFTYARVNANIPSAVATGTVVGSAYTGVNRWQFIQFGNFAIATNGSEKVQYYDINSSTYFGDLATTAPIAKHITTVRDFVVCANIGAGTNPARVNWSDINDPTDWTSGGASQSDFQELPDGGDITGITGGEVGIVFLEKAIVRMTYSGSPLFFQFDTISRNIGCVEGGSIAQYGGLSYFLSDDGFYSCDGINIVGIGAEKVDRYFYNNANIGDIDTISTAVDPERNLIIWNYTTTSGPRGLLIYNFQTKKWCEADTDVDFLSTLATSGVSLEGIDTAYNITAGSFVVTKQYTIRSVGTTDYTLIGAVANTVGVLFTATGVGSGTGVAIDMAASATALKTVDTLTTTLDDRLYKGGKFLFGGVRDAKIITFTGTAATANIITNDLEYGYNSVLSLVRPSIDNGSANVSVASRRKLNDTITYGSSVSASSENRCPVRSAGRYHRVNVTPTGSIWSSAIGVDVDYSEQGTR
jgi:hypothetical protein